MNYAMICYLLGSVLKLEALFLLLPCVTGLFYGEYSTSLVYLLTAAFSLLLGFVIGRTKAPEKRSFYPREGFVTVSLSWILLSAVGALPFVLSGDIPDYTDALFETISGFTTTGASILPLVEAVSHAGLMWRSFTHWVGGMGVIVFMLALIPSAGGSDMHLMRAESPGPSVGKLVPKVRHSALILYGIYLLMTVLQVAILIITGMPLFDALTISFGTAGTGGFAVRNSGFADYTVVQQAVVTVFMILFGINFNFYFFLLAKKWKDAFEMEEIRWYLGIIAGSILIITVNIAGRAESLFRAFHDAAFQVGSIITTTGFATADFDNWPQLSRTILVMLMFIGACAGSTGGGFKVSRMLILFKTVRRNINQFIHPHGVRIMKMDGKQLEEEEVRGVSAYLVTYVVLFAISVLLLAFDDKDLITNFTAVTATFNNIGPGLGVVGPAGNYSSLSVLSKYVLMFDMLAGRLELYPVLLLFVPSVWRKK